MTERHAIVDSGERPKKFKMARKRTKEREKRELINAQQPLLTLIHNPKRRKKKQPSPKSFHRLWYCVFSLFLISCCGPRHNALHNSTAIALFCVVKAWRCTLHHTRAVMLCISTGFGTISGRLILQLVHQSPTVKQKSDKIGLPPPPQKKKKGSAIV